MKSDLLLNWPAVAFVYAFTGGGVCAFVPTERLAGAMLVLLVAALVLACVAWVDHTSGPTKAPVPTKAKSTGLRR